MTEDGGVKVEAWMRDAVDQIHSELDSASCDGRCETRKQALLDIISKHASCAPAPTPAPSESEHSCELTSHAQDLIELIDRDGLRPSVVADYLQSYDARKCCIRRFWTVEEK